jgi:hypothetical protein
MSEHLHIKVIFVNPSGIEEVVNQLLHSVRMRFELTQEVEWYKIAISEIQHTGIEKR